MDDDCLGQDFVFLALNGSRGRRRKLDVVLVLLRRVLRLAAEFLDHREVHHLVERRLFGDRVDSLIEEIRGRPGSLETRGVVLIEEEIAILRVVRRVRVAEHAERVAFRNGVAGRHQLGHFLFRFLRLEIDHRIEDAARDPFHDVGVVLGEVRAREPDVGDQLVGCRRRHEHVVALDLLQVVDVGGPADAAGEPLVGVERGRSLEGVLGEFELHFGGLHAGVDERVQDEEMRR